MTVEGSPTNTGKGQGRRRKRGLAAWMVGSADTYGPDANIAWIEGAARRGEITEALREALVAVENALGRVARALEVCQPRGATKSLAVRWWKVDGSHAVLRRPVLVRLERVGKELLPRRLRSGRRPKLRVDGGFALSANLVPRLLDCYVALYAEWRKLRELVMQMAAYLRVERRACERNAGVVAAKSRFVEASILIGRGLGEAAGYDMEWVDRFCKDRDITTPQ